MTSIIEPLPTLLIEPLVRAALAEDMGRAGDITSRAIFPADARCSAAAAISRPASAPLDGESPAARRLSVRTASSSDGRSRTTPTVSSMSRRTSMAALRCGRGHR